MMGSTHLIVGVSAGSWLAAGLAAVGVPVGVAALAIPVAAYAALLPDLDHPRSTATYSLGPITMLISFVLRLFVTHRGATHDPLHGPVGFGSIAALAGLVLPSRTAEWFWVWGLAVAVGVASHIWADARTIDGIPWRGRQVNVGRPFRTGSRHEKRLAASVYRPVALASIALAVWAAGVAS